jgi:hypothetical protein
VSDPEVVLVTEADELYRRLHWTAVRDGEVLSVAYKRSGKPASTFSVDIARLTTPETSVGLGPAGSGVGILVAGVPMGLGFSVTHSPEMGNDAHANVTGDNTKQKCRLLAEATNIHIEPDAPEQ